MVPPTDTVSRFQPPLFFVGLVLVLAGLALYFLAIGFSIVRLALQLGPEVRAWNEALLWYSGMPTTVGVLLVGLDLALLLPAKRRTARRRALEPLAARDVVVALTAYNDEASIGDAVARFPPAIRPVRQVIVVDNNSRDATFAAAEAAGARVVTESSRRATGSCVYRCLQRGAAERACDLDGALRGRHDFPRERPRQAARLRRTMPHIVNGTRIVEQLRAYSTQLSTFMYYGNFFVGKLLEVKHLGRGTFTDVGTTYKLIRRDSLVRLMPAAQARRSTSSSMPTSWTRRWQSVKASSNARSRSIRGSASARAAMSATSARLAVGHADDLGPVYELALTMSQDAYFRTRFAADARRDVLWTTLCRFYFSKLVAPSDCVLELGAGYGAFINNVAARRRIAVDSWPGFVGAARRRHRGACRRRHGSWRSCSRRPWTSSFASNLFEHVSQEQFAEVLARLGTALSARAR